MKYLYLIILIHLFSFPLLFSQEVFLLQDSIEVPVTENAGFGQFIAGVDFDGDGMSEVYAVNNMIDLGGAELIPRLYKFEFNGTSWDSVWGVEMNSITAQNSWAALTYGDWDNDGKMEIIWGPINNSSAGPNQPRVLVFEYSGDGDKMGVEIFGSFEPNAKWNIVDQDNFNLRPIVWELVDIDNDGTLELVFADRAGTYFYTVISVDNIPDDADGSETWTLEASGEGSGINLSTIYDMAIVDSSVYLIHNDGSVTPVKYSNGTYTVEAGIPNAVPGGSWKSAQVADIDNDGTKEIVVAGWSAADNSIFLLQETSSGLTTTEIAGAESLITSLGRFNGGAQGDIDQDGNIDFVFGTRQAVPNGAILRLEYLGGDITVADNYSLTIIDSLYPKATTTNRFDEVSIANIDDDSHQEVLYTDANQAGRIPIIILDPQIATSVYDDYTPKEFFLEQNYPNPFNPSTNIKFGLQKDMNIDLRVYNIVGEEIAVLIEDQFLAGGTYTITFNAEGLPSGIYFYKLKAGNQILSNKMMLLK